MVITKKFDNGRMVVAVSGRVDTNTAPELSAALQLDSVKDLLIDLSSVPYMSSAGLRCLLVAQKSMSATGGVMRLADVSPTVMEVLDLTGFSSIFTIVKTTVS